MEIVIQRLLSLQVTVLKQKVFLGKNDSMMLFVTQKSIESKCPIKYPLLLFDSIGFQSVVSPIVDSRCEVSYPFHDYRFEIKGITIDDLDTIYEVSYRTSFGKPNLRSQVLMQLSKRKGLIEIEADSGRSMLPWLMSAG